MGKSKVDLEKVHEAADRLRKYKRSDNPNRSLRGIRGVSYPGGYDQYLSDRDAVVDAFLSGEFHHDTEIHSIPPGEVMEEPVENMRDA